MNDEPFWAKMGKPFVVDELKSAADQLDALRAEVAGLREERTRLWKYCVMLESGCSGTDVYKARETTGVDWIAIHTEGISSLHHADTPTQEPPCAPPKK